MDNTNKSEVAQLLARIDAEYKAGKLGLTGLAITAQHRFITARQENIAAHVMALREQVGDRQAFTLLASLDDTPVDVSKQDQEES